MKKILAGLVLGVAVLSQSVGANLLDDCLCGTFGVWGQGTYLKPTDEGQIYSQQTPETLSSGTDFNGSIKSRSVCPKYNWGFEAGAIYLTGCDCFYAKLFGGWTKFTDTNRIQGTLQPQLPLLDPAASAVFTEVIGQGFGSLRTEYWYLDGRVGHFLMRGCGSNVHAFLGVRYVSLCQRLTAAFTGLEVASQNEQTEIRQRQRSEFSGTGPGVGLGGQFCVWGDFGLSGEISTMALIGPRRNRLRTFQILPESDLSQTNDYQADHCIVVIPAINMKAGATWSMERCNYKGSVEIGYKLDHYLNAFKSTSTMGKDFQTFYVLRDAGFAGPYISVGLVY